MKNTIFTLGLFLILLGCTKETPVTYALLSGKIENLKAKRITLAKVGNPYKKEISIESGGAFSDTIKATSGLYVLTADKHQTSLYLNHGDVVNFLADTKDFKKSIRLSGKGSGTTNYLLIKNKKNAELKGDKKSFYSLEEADFKEEVKNLDLLLNSVIDTVEGINPVFKASEKRNLRYNYLLELVRYVKGRHKYYSKKESYTPSEDFLSELEVLDVSNDKDFMISSACKQLVTDYYVNKIVDLTKKDSIEFMYAKVKVHSKIKNEIIKNDLIFSGAEHGMISTPNFEDYYKIFINASTNKKNNAKMTATYNKLLKIKKGEPSPTFTDYVNHAGGKLSLEDLKGKYTYIDLWATWCAPCLAEVPYLKKVEKAYHGKNINFLGISIDEFKDYDKWDKMVEEKELGGIQVFADKSFKSQFLKDYFVSSIPHFILIDPQGKIVAKKAPRPSNPELIDLFNELDI